MIDNIEIIIPLLNFESEDDFYYLQIIRRKKENPQLEANSRVVKNYYIRSVEYLQDKYEEIKKLCEVFNARACIRLNKRSFRQVAFKTMENVANVLGNQDYKFVKNCYDRACGQHNKDPNKTWILDVDKKFDFFELMFIRETISQKQPIGDKFVDIIDSKNGYHIITKPFNCSTFGEDFPNIELHKDNPTNLYIP